MTRNELYLLLAGSVAAAALVSGPMSPGHAPPVTLASLHVPVSDLGTFAQPAMPQHGFDHQ